MSTEEKKSTNGDSKHAQSMDVKLEGFDLKNYMMDYRGVTLIRRLVHIGTMCSELRLAAFRAAIAEAKKGTNVDIYISTVSQAREQLGSSLGDDWGFDKAWTEKVKRKNVEKANQQEVKYTQQRRDEDEAQAVFATLKQLITSQLERGKYEESATRMREAADFAYSSTEKLWLKVASLNLAVETKFEQGTFVGRAQSALSLNRGGSETIEARIHTQMGLHSLYTRQYSRAADRFRLVAPGALNAPDVASKRDVALYGTLCALASYQRGVLQRTLLNSRFNVLLDLIPGLKQMVTDFVQCKFKAAFSYLDGLVSRLKADYYMHDHYERIFSKIRELAVVQYFSPFSHAKISRMAEVFGVSQEEMERRLVKLIKDNGIKARIDNRNKVLIARTTNVRIDTYRQALDSGTTYVRDVKSLLMQMSLHAGNFVVTREREGGKGGPESKSNSYQQRMDQNMAIAMAASMAN